MLVYNMGGILNTEQTDVHFQITQVQHKTDGKMSTPRIHYECQFIVNKNNTLKKICLN